LLGGLGGGHSSAAAYLRTSERHRPRAFSPRGKPKFSHGIVPSFSFPSRCSNFAGWELFVGRFPLRQRFKISVNDALHEDQARTGTTGTKSPQRPANFWSLPRFGFAFLALLGGRRIAFFASFSLALAG